MSDKFEAKQPCFIAAEVPNKSAGNQRDGKVAEAEGLAEAEALV